MRHHRYKNHNTFAPFGQIMEDLFNKSIGDIVGGDISLNTPSVNTYETERAYVLDIATPGISKENINIEIEKNHLVISADLEKGSEGPKFKRREFDYSKFSRRFKLKDDINLKKISASHNLGVLTITLPKLDAEVVNKKTKIKIE